MSELVLPAYIKDIGLTRDILNQLGATNIKVEPVLSLNGRPDTTRNDLTGQIGEHNFRVPYFLDTAHNIFLDPDANETILEPIRQAFYPFKAEHYAKNDIVTRQLRDGGTLDIGFIGAPLGFDFDVYLDRNFDINSTGFYPTVTCPNFDFIADLVQGRLEAKQVKNPDPRTFSPLLSLLRRIVRVA